jgi:hypothetical protein
MMWVCGIVMLSAVGAAAQFADRIPDRVEWVLVERDSPPEPDDRPNDPGVRHPVAKPAAMAAAMAAAWSWNSTHGDDGATPTSRHSSTYTRAGRM